MKNNYSFLIVCLLALTSISFVTTLVAKKKHRPQKSTEILLNKMKDFIDKKRIAKIAKLEKSKKPEKQAQAEILKKRNRLDHIRIVGNNGVTYLQLENSALPIPLQSRYYYFEPKELENHLNELKQHGLSIDQNTKAIVYPSGKRRMNFAFGSWYTYNDLYSASIKVNFDIKDPEVGYTVARSSFDKDNKITWKKTGNSLKTS